MKLFNIIGDITFGVSLYIWYSVFDMSGGIVMIAPFTFLWYLLYKVQDHDKKYIKIMAALMSHKKTIETIQKQIKTLKKDAKTTSVSWNKDFKVIKKDVKDLEKDITDVEKIVTKNRNYEATLKTLTRKIKGETTRDTLIQESTDARKLRIQKRKEATKNVLNENKMKTK